MAETPLNLNDYHRNSLLAGFKYIDRLLAEGLAALSSGADDGAIFSPVRPDATPVQRKIVGDQIVRLRRTVRAALEACAITVRPPTVGAIWSLRSYLIAVDIAVEELGPGHLAGYGPVDEATAAGVREFQAQIRTRLGELRDYLAAGLGGDLAARLGRLDQTTDEVRLLRELDRIITAHGLVEFRQQLALLLERLEKNWWTVAFVGRVSCGKSSLLNYLLAADVLPSGVTPVTAVPIRIVTGPVPVAIVALAAGKPERIDAAQLSEFASEERNPGNARHVTDILLELPAPRLAGEICFVDTPGLGSLATAGAAQTMAFLPRCDAGVLLIDAAATPTEDDLAVARTLEEGGAEVLVVVSKSDLLAPSDREKMRTYVARQLAGALGQEVPVALVSIASGHTALTEEWWAGTLGPRQARHRELAGLTLRRKIGGLREAVAVALSRRAGNGSALVARPDLHAQFGAARAAIEAARRRAYDISFQSTPAADTVLAGVAPSLAGTAAGDDISAALASELGRAAARLAGHFEALLHATRLTAEQALAGIGEAAAVVELPAPSSRPLFDPAPVLGTGSLPTSWRRWPAEAARRAALRQQLRSRLAPALADALQHHAHALVGWSHHYLDDLAARFNAQAGLAEAGFVSASEAGAAPSPELAGDLTLLRDWNSRPAA
jgi:GTP-binding protein EngB required for normal cell division